MDPTAAVCPPAAPEKELDLSQFQREQRMVFYLMDLLYAGKQEEEIRAALQEFVATRKWTGLEMRTFEELVAEAKLLNWARELKHAPAPPRERLQTVSLDMVEPEPVRWLWRGKIPVGKVTVVFGEAAMGKTNWSLDLAARVSAGIDWPQLPCTESPGPAPGPGRVLILNAEDDMADTIRPRLAASGANLPNIIAIRGLKPTQQKKSEADERDFDLERDIPLLRQQIAALGDVRLVIIDPLEAYCKSGPRTQRMRTLIAALGKVAKDCGVAVVVISGRNRCDLPVKHVWRVDSDVRYPDLRWWVPVRCSCGRLAESMAFRVTDKGIEWDLRAYSVSPGQLQGCTGKQERNDRKRELNMLLLGALALGARPAKEVQREGARYGWSVSQMKRAKEPLHIKSYKDPSPQGQWMWELTDRSLVGITLPSEPPISLPGQLAAPDSQRAAVQPVSPATADPAVVPVQECREDVVVPLQPKPIVRPSVAGAPAPGCHSTKRSPEVQKEWDEIMAWLKKK